MVINSRLGLMEKGREVFGFHHLHETMPHSAAAGTVGTGMHKCTHFTTDHQWKRGFRVCVCVCAAAVSGFQIYGLCFGET